MGSSTSTATTPEPAPRFLEVFRRDADADGCMSFARFMALALYDPQVGYYRQERTRVGYEAGTDFYTASTSGPVFGELVAAACAKLLRDRGADPGAYMFVEIGAETAGGVLAGVAHPFGGVRVIPLGGELELAGRCVVFSNELFDAQPCERYVFREGRWRELGVRLTPDGQLVEVELVAKPQPGSEELDLPGAEEGYHFDAPRAAAALAETIARRPWQGLFVAFDYGKSFTELASETPAGTARSYYRHTQSNDLLARPGEQDLTCHVCWDWLAAALRRQGFAPVPVESQEAFFVRHAGEYIATITAAEAARFSRKKLALMQLLHPAHLGFKFQVLAAWR